MKKAKPARTVREFKDLMQTDPKKVDFIRNMDDWKKYSKNADKDKNHPLYGLSKKELSKFTKELVFNKGGIAGANVKTIQRKLTYLRYQKLFARLGMGIGLAADHSGYYCKSKGTCKKVNDHICTSNC